ncbi:hypothetical protein F4678DRAFT_478311 [Xylaria arbuscula]|nr:hypothetical protein F4678DRAFT_478311 [Xylaria arbuscula]
MSSPPLSEPIAIIGSSCRFSGNANSPSALWNLLTHPRDLSRSPPADRFDLDGFYHADAEHHGTTNVRGSYFLEDDIRSFDASFFNITPKEAEAIDPQHRILLETIYEALESAGLTIQELQGSSTSVYVGLMIRDFMDVQARDPDYFSQYMVTGTSSALNANRISYFFDWKGPSLTIDTACSSSLVAIHQAVLGLRAGESRMACVSGSNLLLGPELFISAANMHMLSSRCRMWDVSAEGYARGDGFGTIMLKSLSNAIRDGDHVQAIIRETGVNSDGRTMGITMPSSEAQAALIRETYRKAGLEPTKESDRCQYFEAHGTGTQAGDPQEASAIHLAFFEDPKSQPQASKLLVGSIKTIIGHTEGAAGIAGVLKAMLALRHGQIPPNLHFNNPQPKVAPFLNCLEVPTKLLPWPTTLPMVPRRASVNSFGFGGTNAHVILESYSPGYHNVGAWLQPITDQQHASATLDDQNSICLPFVFSANSEQALRHLIQNYAHYVDTTESINLRDLSWTLLTGRSLLPVRTAFGVLTSSDLSGQIRREIERVDAGGGDMGIHSRIPEDFRPTILGIFTGQGAQWPTMGKNLIVHSAQFANTMNRLEKSLKSLPDPPSWSLVDELSAAPPSSRLGEAALSQPLCTAVQIGLVDILHSLGIELAAVVGHSSGEIAAAYAAGIVTAEDGIRIAYYRGVHARLAGGMSGAPGSMLAAGMGLIGAQAFVESLSLKSRLSVAASNSAASVTLSGDADAIHEAKKMLDGEKKFARVLQVDTAYHSHHMLPCAGPYVASLKACRIRPREATPSCAWISSVYGSNGTPTSEELASQYWSDNMTKPVLFSEALERALVECGPFDAVIEVGPHPALKGPAMQTIRDYQNEEVPYTGLLDRKLDDVAALNTALGYLWKHCGPFMDFAKYESANCGKNVVAPTLVTDLPLYPWDHDNEYWRESRLSREYRLHFASPHTLLGKRTPGSSGFEVRWRNILRQQEVPWAASHRVQNLAVLPTGAYCAMMLEAARAIAGESDARVIELRDVQLLNPVRFVDASSVVELTASIRRDVTHAQEIVCDKDVVIEAEFLLSSASPDSDSRPELVASSRVYISLGSTKYGRLRPNLVDSQLHHSLAVRSNDFYSSLKDSGISYVDPYLALHELERSWGGASAIIHHQPQGERDSACSESSLLESCIQMGYHAFAHPGDGSLWSPFLPQKIARVTVDLQSHDDSHYHGVTSLKAISHISGIHGATSKSLPCFLASSEVYDPRANSVRIQMEDITFTSLSPATISDDRELFFNVVWNHDIGDCLARDTLEETSETIHAREYLDAVVSSYIYDLKSGGLIQGEDMVSKQLATAVIHDNRSNFHDSQDYKAAPAGLERTECEQQLSRDRSLFNEIQDHLATRFSSSVGVETNIPRRYALDALPIFDAVNKRCASITRAISHRFSQMHILEIGPDCVGPSTWLPQSLVGGASSHLFGSTGPRTRPEDSRSVTVRRTHVESLCPTAFTQGIPLSGFEFALISFILHGRSSLGQILSDLRASMKPGAFVLFIEPTADYTWLKFLLCGILDPESPIHQDQKFGSPISLTELDDSLRKHGFSGIDHVEQHSGLGLIVSQVVDEKIDMLRHPLQSPSLDTLSGDILFIGGETMTGYRVFKSLTGLMLGWRGALIFEPTLSLEILRRHADQRFISAVIIDDGSQPYLSKLFDERREAMPELFGSVENVFWVTLHEDAHSISQSALEIGHEERAGEVIGSQLVRQLLAQLWQLSRTSHLWVNETRLRRISSRNMIPRVLPDADLNNQLNSSRRVILEDVKLSDFAITLQSIAVDGSTSYYAKRSHSLHHDYASPTNGKTDHTIASSLFAIRVGDSYLHASICRFQDGQDKVLLFASAICSAAAARDHLSIPIRVEDAMEYTFLGVFLQQWVAELVFNTLLPGKNILFEPEDELASLLAARCAGTDKELIFLTQSIHDAADSQIPWAVLHPRSSKTHLRRSILRLASHFVSFVSFETSQDSLIRDIVEILPSQCVVSEGSFFQTTSQTVRPGKELLIPDLTEIASRVSTIALASSPTLASHSRVLSAVEVVGDVAARPFDVVNWSGIGSMRIASQPFETDSVISYDKTYLIVDIADDIAECIAHWLVDRGAFHIVFIHSSASQTSVPWVANFQRLGIRLDVKRLDIRDRSEMKQLSDMFPSSLGVIYGGALSSSGNNSPRNSIHAIANLDEAFTSRDLDFFIALTPQVPSLDSYEQFELMGHLAALVSQRQARGSHASILALSEIQNVSSTVPFINHDECFAKLSEADFHALLDAAISCMRHAPQTSSPLITSLERVSLSSLEKLPAWRQDPSLSHIVFTAEDSSLEDTKGPAESIKEQLKKATSPVEAVSALMHSFTAHLAVMLGLSPDGSRDNTDLVTLGIDSLMASDVRTWFLKTLDADVPVLQILGGSTIREICEAVVSIMENASPTSMGSVTSNGLEGIPGFEATLGPLLSSGATNAATEKLTSTRGSWTPVTVGDIESIDTSQSEADAPQNRDITVVRSEKLSYGQNRLWFPSTYLDQPTPFNCTTSYTISGTLDISRLGEALKRVTQRHEIFRTTFSTCPSTGDSIQTVVADSQFHLRASTGNMVEDVDYEFKRQADYVFDLQNGDTFIATVISHTPRQHTIIFGYHHIIMDGVSWQITLNDMATFYNKKTPEPASPAQYVDFALHSSQLVASGAHEKKLSFWDTEFMKTPEPLPLFPFANASSRKVLTQYHTLDVVRNIDQKLVAGIKRASLGAKTTSFHFYLAALQAILHSFLGINDICLGIIDANRSSSKFLNTVGFLLDMIPLNLRLNSKERFTTTMTNTRNKVYAALSNSGVPLDVILQRLKVQTSSEHTPLFQILVNYRMGALKAPPLGEANMNFLDYRDAKAPFDLTLSIDEKEDGTGMLTFTTQTYLYDQTGMTLIVETYLRFLELLSKNSSLRLAEIPIFDEALINRGIEVGTGKTIDFGWPSKQTVVHRVDHWIESQPNHIAVKDMNGQSLTYSQMSCRIDSITASLDTMGVKTGKTVAVFCEPAVDTVCCILATMKIGAAYVALDVRNSPERLAATVRESSPATIIYHRATSSRLDELHASSVPLLGLDNVQEITNKSDFLGATPSSVAFIQYTSGTTGRPKGIPLTHYNLAMHCASVGERLNFDREVVLQQSGQSFDASVAQIFYALVFGGTIIVGTNRGDPSELAEQMRVEKVTVSLIMISEMSALLDCSSSILSQCHSWRVSMCGGEAFTVNLVRKFQELGLPTLELVNAYGPAETTIISSLGEIPYRTTTFADNFKVPVGPPIPNYGVYVLDEEQRGVPLGWPGELCIAGPGVASGYSGLPELTQEKFKPDNIPKPGEQPADWQRIYRTGDRARLLEDGSFVFLGRIDGDSQIKLRGIRIELDEVTNSILQASEGILSNAATLIRGETNPILVAYIVFSSDKGATHRSNPSGYLRKLLQSLPLPVYMRPAVAVPLDVLPFTTSGKLDTKVLAAIPLVQDEEEQLGSGDLTETERKLKGVWEDVLSEVGVKIRIDKHSDFFSVGGNSLLLIRLRAGIQNCFRSSISLARLFQASTLESLAKDLEQQLEAPDTSSLSRQSLLDWDVETRPPADLPSAQFPFRSGAPLKTDDLRGPATVVLTGSTGFLGTEILRQLISHPDVGMIHCIAIRPGRRVNDAFMMSPKVVSHEGDLADPQLGLTSAQSEAIFSAATVIIHNGAEVSHMKSYPSLRAPNVGSTKELLTLAARYRTQSWTSFHYVSSAGVGHLVPAPVPNTNADTKDAKEDRFPPISLSQYPPPRDGSDGYVAAKWASEQILERAAAAAIPGLRVVVHRPSNVTGDGVGDRDIVHSLMRYSLALKAVPDMAATTGAFDFVGVEVCALGIVKAALDWGENRYRAVASASASTSSSLQTSSGSGSESSYGSGYGSVEYQHCAGSIVVPVDRLAEYLGERCGRSALPVISWSEWLAGAQGEGLDELVVAFLREVNGNMRMPLLVQG